MKIINDDKLDIKIQPLSESDDKKLWDSIYYRIIDITPQPNKLLLWRPAYITLAVLIFLFTGSFGAFIVSADAKPGDALFPVKLGYEKLQLQLTTRPEKKSELALKFSQQRLNEVDEVLQQNSEKITPVENLPNNVPVSTSTPSQATSTTKIESKTIKNSIKNLERNHQMLVDALNYIEDTKQNLEKNDPEEKTKKLNSLVDQLSNRTQKYLDDLEKIKSQITDNQEVKDKINHSEKELKERFKLDRQNENQSEKDQGNDNKDNNRKNQSDD